MRRLAGTVLIILFGAFFAKAQDPIVKADTAATKKIDTLQPAPYINVGKIAARKNAYRSAILPGLGQISNQVTFWSVSKVAIIYGGFTALTLSYIDNNRLYKVFLAELQYRAANNGNSPPGSLYESFSQTGLFAAKDVYRRNREVIIFSYVGVYAINILDAYVASRLKYLDVGEDLAFKITPSIMSTNTAYAVNLVPSIKLSIRL